MKGKRTKISDISKNPDEQLLEIMSKDLMPLPYPCDRLDKELPVKPLTEEQKDRYECSLDGVSAIVLPKPKSKEEEDKLVQSFLSGLKKLLSKEDNWTFLQPLILSLEYCAKCLNCSEECQIYLASGQQEIYCPTYRSEVLRRIIKKYLHKGNKAFSKFTEGDIELNWTAIARLAELAYRCPGCRRCAQACARGVDNGLITRELRKLFSQEMGIAPKELHELGTVQQLKVGASTGISPKAFKNIVQFMEEEIEEKTGKRMKIPIDREGADILLMHNSGEFFSWPENPEAFAIIFEAAGLSWTLSSELAGYEATNYGVWYDDIQLARIALKQSEIARKLKVKKVVIGECGHATKAMIVIADRVLTGEANIPRESCLPLLADLVCNEKLKLDPKRNDFPVTLHDSCNIVRLMGIVEPQRRILREICPQFREMEPHGVDNYCCGGSGGFAIMSSMNFTDWRTAVAGRMKMKQILEAFQDVISPEIKKYVCATCSNCKGQLRDLFNYYDAWEKCGILYGGIAELIVNAMVDIKEPFIRWEWH
ncbi:MAG: (Fe-S)-binding protein [Dehalococcoidales bacterium]